MLPPMEGIRKSKLRHGKAARSAALRAGLRQSGRNAIFLLPGTYSSARKRALGNVTGLLSFVPAGLAHIALGLSSSAPGACVTGAI
jgi:hypothetical protein